MMIQVLKSKIHRVTVTESNLNYIGSVTIDEDLMDAANFAMIEFLRPKHPKAFFAPTDSNQSPGRVWLGRSHRTQRANTDDHQEKVKRNLEVLKSKKEKEDVLKSFEKKDNGYSKDLQAFYSTVKGLTVFGYTESKFFMTKEIVYELVPGRYNAYYPVKNLKAAKNV